MSDQPVDPIHLMSRALSWTTGPDRWPNLRDIAPDLAESLDSLGEAITDGLLGVGATDWTEANQVDHWTGMRRTFNGLADDLERMATDDSWPGVW